jgi:hypothetical protein
MLTVRKTLLAGLAWLTAVATLVAGSPYLDCRCPDGRVKLFCLPTAAEPEGCCCGGACCPSTSGASCGQGNGSSSANRGAACPCCRRHATQEQERSSDSVQAGQGCCTRQLVPPEVSVPTHTRTAVSKDLTAAPCPAPDAALASSPTTPADRQTPSWLIHPPAPPPDLITTLQRLLI